MAASRYDLSGLSAEPCMSIPFKTTLITPECIVLDAHVVAAQIPAYDGLVGILVNRAPLLAKLGTGILRLDLAGPTGGVGDTERFLVSGGYAQMKGDDLTILTNEAIPAAKVSPEMIAAEEARLASVEGVDAQALERRQAIQARISAMRMA
jgi:F-type H+-transporting ATPase subunit epsilon